MAASTDFATQYGVKDAYDDPNSSRVAVVKELIVYTDATPTAADTIAITLADFDIKTVWGVDFWYHSTANSVVVPVAMVTTALSAGVFTMTIPAGPATKVCVFKISYI